MKKISLNVVEYQRVLSMLEVAIDSLNPSMTDVLKISECAQTMYQYRVRLNEYAKVIKQLRKLLQLDFSELQRIETEFVTTDEKLSNRETNPMYYLTHGG